MSPFFVIGWALTIGAFVWFSWLQISRGVTPPYRAWYCALQAAPLVAAIILMLPVPDRPAGAMAMRPATPAADFVQSYLDLQKARFETGAWEALANASRKKGDGPDGSDGN